MQIRLFAAVLLLSAATTGCYHATIDTGLPASGQVIEKRWASCRVYGLVPPALVETAAKCPNGVARVETQHSFLNYLVGGITFGIYTPMKIIVTCGDKSKAELIPGEARQVEVPAGACRLEVEAAFAKAANQAQSAHQPLYVTFGD